MLITSALTARATRQVQSYAQQREAARVRAFRRQRKQMDDPINKTKATRIGAPTCVVSAHLNYVSAFRIDMWNRDHEHVNDIIPNFTKLDIED